MTEMLTYSDRVDRASATEAVDSGSIPGRVKPKTIKIVFIASLFDVQQLKKQCEIPPCVVDRRAGGSLTQRPKGPFAVSRSRQFGK